MFMINTGTVIVGQGITGSLLAWELWKRGEDFLVMDHPDPSTSSRIAAGLFIPLVFRTMKPVENIRTYLGFMDSAYKEMEEILDKKFFHHHASARLVPEGEFHLWEKALNTEVEQYIKSLKKSVRIPGIKNWYAVAHIEPSGFLDVLEFVRSVANWLKENQRYFSYKVDYNKIKINDEEVIIHDQVKTKKVVFCEGAAGFQNPFFNHAGYSPNKGEIIEITAPGLSTEYIIRGRDVFILPVGKDTFKVGATYSHDLAHNQPTQEGLNQLTSRLEKIIDVPYQIISHTAGIRPGIRDRKPILGCHPGLSQLYTFTGLGSRGVMYAPYFSHLMADLLTGKISMPPGEVGVGRYMG
jgi:glycine oxidase